MDRFRRKWRWISIDEIEHAVRLAMDGLSGNASRVTTEMMYEQFAAQFAILFDELQEDDLKEWQYRPSIERDKNNRRKVAGWLFDLVWYSVARKTNPELCLFTDVALIVESELSSDVAQAQHDFLKLLGFRSWIKVAIVGCSENDCWNLVVNAIRECRNITEGRYMVWRVAGTKVVLEAEFDLFWEGGKISCNTIGGKMFDDNSEHCWWNHLKGRLFNPRLLETESIAKLQMVQEPL